VFTRDLPAFRDAAVILVDQLREIWIDSDLDVVDTTLYYTLLTR
jgi:peptide/nickel transport system substrate-binding protein